MNKTETTVKAEGNGNQEKVVLLTSMKELEAEQGAPKKAKPSAKADAEPKVPKKVELSAKAEVKPKAPKKAESPAKQDVKPEAPKKAKAPAKPETSKEAEPSTKADVKPEAPKKVEPSAKVDAKPEVPKKVEPSTKADAKPEGPKKAEPSAKVDAKPEVPKETESPVKQDVKPEAPKKEESPAKQDVKPEAPKKEESPVKQDVKPEASKKEESPAKPSAKMDAKPEVPGPEAPAKAEAPAAPPKAEEPPAPVAPVPAPPAAVERPAASVLDSPLKMMKQEFDRRACVIRTEMANIQNSFVTIGFQLHWIKTNNMYKVLDYKTISEYAEKEYNIKRGTCANLINIIENFAERDEQGHVIESITECYRNFSSSQLLAMIGMPEEVQQQVTPDMSVRSILKLRKGEPETPPIDATRAIITDIKDPEPEAPAPASKIAARPAPAAPKTAPTQATPPVNKGILKTPLPERKPAVSSTSYSSGYTPKAAEPPKTGKPETVEIAELGSYNDYESKQGKIAQMMKNVFSKNEPVKVKIVCVYKD